MDIDKTRKEYITQNLKRLMICKAMSQKSLAQIAGVTEACVSKWLKDNSVTYDKLFKIAEYFNMSVEQFTSPPAQQVETVQQNTISAFTLNKLPLLSWVQAGVWSESIVYDDIEYIDTPIKLKNNKCFALKVRGDSMSCATGKSYFDGCFVVIDPLCSKNVEDLNHKVVVARTGSNATIKEFVLDGNTPYLKAWNTAYPTLSVSEDTEILGVVIGMWSE